MGPQLGPKTITIALSEKHVEKHCIQSAAQKMSQDSLTLKILVSLGQSHRSHLSIRTPQRAKKKSHWALLWGPFGARNWKKISPKGPIKKTLKNLCKF